MEVVVQDEWYSAGQCRENPKTLYVFGDNTEGIGCGGQAQIRYEPNSIGIPTKRYPGMEDRDFFNDDISQFLKVEQAITNLLVELTQIKVRLRYTLLYFSQLFKE